MKLKRLEPEYEIGEFDCGDEDLNEFLLYDAKPCMELNIANTFILVDDGRIVAYFCLLNDKIRRIEITGSRWKMIKNVFQKVSSSVVIHV